MPWPKLPSCQALYHGGKALQGFFTDNEIGKAKPLPVLVEFLNNLLHLADQGGGTFEHLLHGVLSGEFPVFDNLPGSLFPIPGDDGRRAEDVELQARQALSSRLSYPFDFFLGGLQRHRSGIDSSFGGGADVKTDDTRLAGRQ